MSRAESIARVDLQRSGQRWFLDLGERAAQLVSRCGRRERIDGEQAAQILLLPSRPESDRYLTVRTREGRALAFQCSARALERVAAWMRRQDRRRLRGLRMRGALLRGLALGLGGGLGLAAAANALPGLRGMLAGVSAACLAYAAASLHAAWRARSA